MLQHKPVSCLNSTNQFQGGLEQEVSTDESKIQCFLCFKGLHKNECPFSGEIGQWQTQDYQFGLVLRELLYKKKIQKCTTNRKKIGGSTGAKHPPCNPLGPPLKVDINMRRELQLLCSVKLFNLQYTPLSFQDLRALDNAMDLQTMKLAHSLLSYLSPV